MSSDNVSESEKTAIAVSVFDFHAEAYQDRFMDFDLYNDSFDLFCDAIPKANAEILELACGPGNITRYLLKKRPDFRILATDLAPRMLEFARKNNPSASFMELDSRDILSLGKTYDAIMCGFCLPYLSKEDTLQLIADSAKILHPKGVLYLSTMEDDYSKSGWKTGSSGKEVYMHYHEAGYLTEALETNGFEVIDLRRKEFPEKDGSLTIDLLITARLR